MLRLASLIINQKKGDDRRDDEIILKLYYSTHHHTNGVRYLRVEENDRTEVLIDILRLA